MSPCLRRKQEIAFRRGRATAEAALPADARLLRRQNLRPGSDVFPICLFKGRSGHEYAFCLASTCSAANQVSNAIRCARQISSTVLPRSAQRGRTLAFRRMGSATEVPPLTPLFLARLRKKFSQQRLFAPFSGAKSHAFRAACRPSPTPEGASLLQSHSPSPCVKCVRDM
jgi:hypothetical protein